MRPKFLFLYTELAGYFLACIKQLVDSHQAEVHIIRWPVNKEAPFQFNIPAGVKLYDKQIFSRSELISLAHKIHPDLVFCSGWMDIDYLAVARSFKKHLPVVIGMDNHWNGSLKQQLARIISPFTLKCVFTHAFVAGAPQHLYARKLSFADEHILQGYYSADVPYFDQCYKQFRQQKAGNFPKRFLAALKNNTPHPVANKINPIRPVSSQIVKKALCALPSCPLILSSQKCCLYIHSV